MSVVRPKTIALDTNFLVGLADGREEYDKLRGLLQDGALIPVICREQLEEMTRGTTNRGIKLLSGCGGPIFELPPFYYVMEAEVYAQMKTIPFDRSGLAGCTQWEALQKLMAKVPPPDKCVSKPCHVSDEPLANWIFCSPMHNMFYPRWSNKIAGLRQLPSCAGDQQAEKAALLDHFLALDSELDVRIWPLPNSSDVRRTVDVTKCPCICGYWNHLATLSKRSDPLTVNDWVDAHRVTESAYVDIFTCDKHVKELLRQGHFLKAGGVACASPDEVYAVCRV